MKKSIRRRINLLSGLRNYFLNDLKRKDKISAIQEIESKVFAIVGEHSPTAIKLFWRCYKKKFGHNNIK